MRKKFGCGLQLGPNISPYCRSMPWMPRGWRCQNIYSINPQEDTLPINNSAEQKEIIVKNLELQLQYLEQQVTLIKNRLKKLEE